MTRIGLMRFQRSIRTGCTGVAVALVMVCCNPFANGQQEAAPQYKTSTGRPLPPKVERDISRHVRGLINGTTPLGQSHTIAGQNADNRQWLGFWYAQLFKRMARGTAKGGYADAVSIRQRIASDLDNSGSRGNSAVHGEIIKVVLRTAPKLARENYHPIVRHNATLLLGDLNDREGDFRTVPVPSAAARQNLLTDLADPNQIDPVRVAALVGLVRHVELEMLPTKRRQQPRAEFLRDVNTIVQLATQLISAESPPGGRSVSGHQWMQRRAMDLVKLLGPAASKPQIIGALEKIVQNSSTPMFLACSAADALGHLNISASNSSADTAIAVGAFAVKSCNDELARIKQWEEEQPEETQSVTLLDTQQVFVEDSAGGAILDETPQDPSQQRAVKARRRLLYELKCLQTGLSGKDGGTGLVKANEGNAKAAAFQQMNKLISELMDSLTNDDITLEQLKSAVQLKGGGLASLIKNGQLERSTPTETNEPNEPFQLELESFSSNF